jgi:hypothetical protein
MFFLRAPKCLTGRARLCLEVLETRDLPAGNSAISSLSGLVLRSDVLLAAPVLRAFEVTASATVDRVAGPDVTELAPSKNALVEMGTTFGDLANHAEASPLPPPGQAGNSKAARAAAFVSGELAEYIFRNGLPSSADADEEFLVGRLVLGSDVSLLEADRESITKAGRTVAIGEFSIADQSQAGRYLQILFALLERPVGNDLGREESIAAIAREPGIAAPTPSAMAVLGSVTRQASSAPPPFTQAFQTAPPRTVQSLVEAFASSPASAIATDSQHGPGANVGRGPRMPVLSASAPETLLSGAAAGERQAQDPMGATCLAELLTPAPTWTASEPFLALQELVDRAEGWGQRLATTLVSLLHSPWLAGTTLAVAAVRVVSRCRARACRAAASRYPREALELPEITSPSGLP